LFPDVQPFLIEEMISSALTLLRILLGPVFSFHALDIAYDAPSHAERYGEVLGCPVRTVTAVAEQLGFSDARSFRRAFKRWSGNTPGTHKRADAH
jgi:AraC-like DNA-binding protein